MFRSIEEQINPRKKRIFPTSKSRTVEGKHWSQRRGTKPHHTKSRPPALTEKLSNKSVISKTIADTLSWNRSISVNYLAVGPTLTFVEHAHRTEISWKTARKESFNPEFTTKVLLNPFSVCTTITLFKWQVCISWTLILNAIVRKLYFYNVIYT